MEFTVNGKRISYHTQGDREFGNETVLLKNAIDLTSPTSWHEHGFTIEPLFTTAVFEAFKLNTKTLLLDCWRKAGLDLNEGFDLSCYHTQASTQHLHLKAVELTKLLQADVFPGGIQKLEQRISEICGQPLIVRNPWDNQRIFHFRVIRPQSGDNNPLHRDVWLPDYDNCINLYIPIAGSNEHSSLILFPGSHLWPESSVERTIVGAEINGAKYNVPAVTAIKGNCSAIRPTPKENEVLVFSPYLIHGGAVNLNADITRISIEVRLWRK